MITIPAILESYRSLKDKTLKVTFETNELTPIQVAEIAQNLGSFGFLAYKPVPFVKSELDTLDAVEVDYNDTGKTNSQRLRGVLYRLFEKDNEGFKTFSTFYDHHMEIITNHFKSKIDG